VDFALPDLDEPYRTALAQAVETIVARFDPVGLVASGSILRGEGDATSDLDIYVIHRQNWRQRIQQRFNGVAAEIFVNPPAMIRDYFAVEAREGRPSTAHMLSTGFVVLNCDPVVDQLLAEAAEFIGQPPNLSAQALTLQRYTAATVLEDAMDIREKNAANALFLLEHAMYLMVHYAFAAANQPTPRHKQILDGLNNVDPTLADLAAQFYNTGDAATRFNLAIAFAQKSLAATGFFEWETELNPI
jgi:hypothetical protein